MNDILYKLYNLCFFRKTNYYVIIIIYFKKFIKLFINIFIQESKFI